MKKIMTIGLILLLWTTLSAQVVAEGEVMPEPSPSLSPDIVVPSTTGTPVNSPAVETVPEHPLPVSSPATTLSPSPEPTASPQPGSGAAGKEAASPSIFDLLEGSSATMEVDMVAYYLSEMSAAAAAGDTDAGKEAEENRNALIDLNGNGETKIAFDDHYLLAKLIYAEAGSDWLSDDFRLCVGEVVLNRVASPEFPDTIYDVIYQKNQYSSVSSPGFSTLVPSQDCVDVAIRLLQGERQMVESVVFQSNYAQGEIFSIHKDRRLGDTFFCISNNLELYP